MNIIILISMVVLKKKKKIGEDSRYKKNEDTLWDIRLVCYYW